LSVATGPGSLRKRLQAVRARLHEVHRDLSQAAASGAAARLQALGREQRALEPVGDTFEKWERAERDHSDALQLLRGEQDPQVRDYYEEVLHASQLQMSSLERQVKLQLLPRDPNDERDLIMEIRAAVGGEEAALFASDLLRMYSRYAERRRWNAEMLNSSPSAAGGLSSVTLALRGRGAYSRLKYEGGGHRVQRVPSTEAQGRIHTSLATVAVLPEADEVDVQIAPEDIKVDVYRSTGPGGQSVNTTDSAVRITHLPTGLVVTCQDEKSQHKNRDKAMRILRARLLERAQAEQHAAIAGQRRLQVGGGERSEKIRTYNFPQNRVTDHRIGLDLYRLQEVLAGDLAELLETLAAADEADRLAALEDDGD
jgi:peptide chain release factor 1